MAATVHDVAKRAGTSVATVSRYLNNYRIREKNAIRIKNAIEEIGYTENIIAKGLKNNRSMTIGVVVPNLNYSFPMAIATAIESEVEKHNYSMTLCNYLNMPARLESKLKFLKDRSVDGIILHVTDIHKSEMLEKCIDQGIPVVTVNGIMDTDRKMDSVLVDNTEASYGAIDYLIRANHRRIGIINGSEDDLSSSERLRGCIEAFRHHGIESDRNIIIANKYNFELNHAYMSAIKILTAKEPPTAVYATNQIMTLAVIKAINDLNLKIPDDISVIGFDREVIYDVFKPALNIIEQPVAAIGKNAASLVLERIKGNAGSEPVKIVLHTSMQINGSVRIL